MKLISFGELSIYHFYPLLIPLSRLLGNETKGLFKLNYYNDLAVILTLYMFIGEIIGGGLLYLIGFNHTKINNETKTSSIHFISFREKDITKIRSRAIRFSWRRIGCIVGFAFCDFIGSTCFDAIGTPEFNYLMQSFQIFVYAIMSNMILRYKVYNHKYLSMTVIVLGVIIVNLYIDFTDFEWFWIPLSFICNSLYAIKYTGNKWLMLNRHFDPMLMLLLEGVFGVFLTLCSLLGLYLYCVGDTKDYYFCLNIHYFKNLKIMDLYYVLVYTSGLTLLNFLIVKTNYHFIPTLLIVSNVLSSFVAWIYITINSQKVVPIALAGYIVIIIGALVYTEMIILHFCKLDYYTKVMINKRSLMETDICQENFYALIDLQEEDNHEDNNYQHNKTFHLESIRYTEFSITI